MLGYVGDEAATYKRILRGMVADWRFHEARSKGQLLDHRQIEGDD